MTRTQRQAHFWVWVVLTTLLVIGVIAALAARPAQATPTPSGAAR